jgi:prevent-host-death family protein
MVTNHGHNRKDKKMKTIPAGKFKTHCLSLLNEVAKARETLVITKYGKPVARVVPYAPPSGPKENPLKDRIVFEKDLIDPIRVKWDALR